MPVFETEVIDSDKQQFLSDIALNMLKSPLNNLKEIQDELTNLNTATKALTSDTALNKLKTLTDDINKISGTLRCLQTFYKTSKR